jgi:RNA polymerase sigma-70 factor (ECF subfamily)
MRQLDDVQSQKAVRRNCPVSVDRSGAEYIIGVRFIGMAAHQSDSAVGLAFGASGAAARSPSAAEQEVIQLFDQLRDRLLRYALSFGLSTEDGEEIIQEVFLALFQHVQRRKPRHNLRGWVFRVAHNLALKRRMANQKELRSSGHASGALAAKFDSANPEEQAMHLQRQQRLLAVLRALPEQDQYCLHLRAEGLVYREIAEVLRMSTAAVSVSLGRSLARLSRADGG